MENGEITSTNIIEVSFPKSTNETEIPHSIAHPESVRYETDGLDSDPLNDLLSEFDDIESFELPQKDDFIHHLENVKEVKLSMSNSAYEMSESILDQVKRINEGFSRLKYYLDEMNIED